MRKVGWFFVELLFFVVGMVGIVVGSVVVAELGWFPTSTFRIEEPWASVVMLLVLMVGFLLGRASWHGKVQRGAE